MERILQDQRVHSEALGHMLQEYSATAPPGPRDGGEPDGRASPSTTASTTSTYSGLNISSEVMMEASRQYGILGERVS